jgi:UDP-N-acetyl-D-mannosaminuronic acid dehydrogenase
MNNFRDSDVCILGLGYVGLTLAVVMADVGFKVTGIEIKQEVCDLIKQGRPHFHEPGLDEKLRRVIQNGSLICENKIPLNYLGTVFIITVGTPLDNCGLTRLDMIENVANEVSANIKSGDLVIMRSTVKLGTTRKNILPILQKNESHFDIAFCPERTLEGKALSELRQLPQIVGGIDRQATLRAAQLFQNLTPTVVRVSNIETAEMIKLIDNAQRDVAFAYANEVARGCDAIGISAAEVINSGKLGYPRTNLPMPGPVGGPCLEKDSYILAESLAEYGVFPEITLAARKINQRQPSEIISYIKGVTDALVTFPKHPTITLMGIAFKGQPATDDLRGTMARPIFDEIKKQYPHGIYRGYDPVISINEIRNFGLEPAADLPAAFRESDIVIILNNHLIYSSMQIEELTGLMKTPGIIYDFWNFYKSSDLHLKNGISYVALGSHGLSQLLTVNNV